MTQPAPRPWLSEIPNRWSVQRIKHVVRFAGGGTPSKAVDDYWGGEIPWASPKDMKSFRIKETQDYITEAAVASSACSLIPAGATLMVVRSGILQHTIPVAINDVAVCLNQDMKALIPEEGMVSRYLAYLVQGLNDRLLNEWVKQGATVESIEHESMANTPIPVPPADQQVVIADYLDAETARIDGLIAEKQRLAGMLVELRGGVIRERTTGADLKVARVSTGDVFMPQLPAGWDLVALGRYSRITNGCTPLKDNLAYWQGGHYPWLNSSVVNGDEVTEGSELVTAEALRQCHLPIVPQGSVLVALTGQGKTRGQATVLRIEATINQHLAAIVCDEDHLDGEFVFWALTGQYAALRMVSDGQGGTKGALTCDELGRFRIPKPPIDVQRAIAKALYDETRKIDDLLKHVEDEIQLLQELRAATITDAVLGRIDVREHMKS